MSEDRYAYVDTGAVRIQQYLARTPTLRGHRAASHRLAEATSRPVIEQVVDGLAEVNPEAGDADGVVSLRLPVPEGASGAGERVEDRVRRVQDRVLAHLRQSLPAAEFQSVWGEGASYLSVYATILRPRTRRGEVRYDLPATAEFPAASLCRGCRTDPAVEVQKVQDERLALCLDCVMRNVARTRTAVNPLTPEGWLREQLGLGGDDAVDNFSDLAALGAPAGGRKANHLATIAVDGNAFGVFFSALAQAAQADPGLREAKDQVSRDLASAAREALLYATLELPLTTEREQLCVVPHVVGGDDVVVTLPADQAWRFVRFYLRDFAQRVEKATAGVLPALTAWQEERGGPSPAPTVPTASAGVVFAHATHPIGLQVEAAGRRLSSAKGAFRGRLASVHWQDVTADGPDAPGHPPVELSVLDDGTGRPTAAASALDGLVRIPASHRTRLAEALRSGGPVTAAVQADRVGHLAAVRPFLPPLHRLEGHPPCGLDLGAALGMARWWPCA
ncbi:Cas10/Cmr2 second palm domain-containing protein [Streptomyces decoyicus]